MNSFIGQALSWEGWPVVWEQPIFKSTTNKIFKVSLSSLSPSVSPSLYLSVCFSLSLSLSHTHKHIHTNTHKYIHSHTLKHIYTNTFTHTKYTHSHIHTTPTHSHTLTHTYKHTQIHTLIHTLRHTYTQTHIHTHSSFSRGMHLTSHWHRAHSAQPFMKSTHILTIQMCRDGSVRSTSALSLTLQCLVTRPVKAALLGVVERGSRTREEQQKHGG
jgi:hypothetical protein